MTSAIKTVPFSKGIRELSDKELNEISRGVGDRARAQTADQKKRMKTSLLFELAAARAAFFCHEKKQSKA